MLCQVREDHLPVRRIPRTPWGLHEICEKIGEGEDLGMVFEGRKSIGMTHLECNEEKKGKEFDYYQNTKAQRLTSRCKSGKWG